MNGTQGEQHENKPLLIQPVPSKVDKDNIYIQQKPNIQPISNMAYPSYESMASGQSLNEIEGRNDHIDPNQK